MDQAETKTGPGGGLQLRSKAAGCLMCPHTMHTTCPPRGAYCVSKIWVILESLDAAGVFCHGALSCDVTCS